MKKIFSILIPAVLSAIPILAQNQCDINVSIMASPQVEDVPDATLNYLSTKLEQMAVADGIVADAGQSQFFLSAKFNHITEDVVPGPPVQTAIHTMLTLYIGDNNAETVYASTTIELRGVGTSSQRAFINAMRSLNSRNQNIASFLNKGKRKIIEYYDRNYPQIIDKAKRSAAVHHYDEALWHLIMIPECSKGYSAAVPEINRYFKAFIDQEGTRLLAAARAAWAAHPDVSGAEEAFGFLLAIDIESSAYPKAELLANEIKQSVKSDRDFELRQKYNDSVDLERRRIQAAKEVGVAFGNGQKETTTNLMWLK